MKYETLRTFRTKSFQVNCDFTEEPDPDLSWCDDADHERYWRGLWSVYLLRVQVKHRATGLVLGAKCLSQCAAADPHDFDADYWGPMASEAIREARETWRLVREPELR